MARTRRSANQKQQTAQRAASPEAKASAASRWAVGGFALLLLAWHFTFSGFYPNQRGDVGGDYSGEATYRVAGYFWARVNGLFDVPWFTPAFCGGLPYFGDPQTSYYSIPQLYAAFMGPIAATYLAVLTFASIGFWGTWLLLRTVFRTAPGAAFLGSALFMFNGFFAHRMILGHVIFHGFMLLPLLLFILLKSLPETHRRFAIARDAVLSGLIVGYWVQAGMASMIAPTALAALAVISLFGALGGDLRPGLLRVLPAAIIACGLSASKLAAASAFISHFDRSSYIVPQTGSLFDSLVLVLETLFISPPDIAASAARMLVRRQWQVDRWEWEYGVTVVPLLILLGAGVFALRAPRSESTAPANPPRKSRLPLACAIALIVILFLPIAFNTYGPTWFLILKKIPIVKSTSVLFRWFIIYIPVVVTGAAVALDRMAIATRFKNAIALSGAAAMVLINLTADRSSYQNEAYNPAPIEAAYNQVARGQMIPHISGIDARLDENHQVILTIDRNDSMASSLSQLACYNPIFGYRLETFPFQTLHPGSAYEETAGVFNVKNPACYLFPEENGCAPGDHFTVGQRAALDSFLAYHPFPFVFSKRQQVANAATLLTLLGLLAFAIFSAVRFLRMRRSRGII